MGTVLVVLVFVGLGIYLEAKFHPRIKKDNGDIVFQYNDSHGLSVKKKYL